MPSTKTSKDNTTCHTQITIRWCILPSTATYTNGSNNASNISICQTPYDQNSRTTPTTQVLRKSKDELNIVLMAKFLALYLKVDYSSHQTLNKFNGMTIKSKSTCKGVSKRVGQTEIAHKDYVVVLGMHKSIRRVATSIRYFSLQIYTSKQSRPAG